MLNATAKDRFWPKVEVGDPADCWSWQGGKNGDGYGRFRSGGRGFPKLNAHRVAWELCNGPIPDGMMVLHNCDNPACCNPQHLRLGTHHDNMADKMERGRVSRTRSRAKLNEAEAAYIRANPEGLKGDDLAAQFGVSKSTISYVRAGKTWA